MRLIAHRLVEARIGQRDRAAGERGAARRIGRRVVQRGRQPFDGDIGESARFHSGPERVAAAELEEQRAHFRRHPLVNDREDLGPAAVFPRPPHSDHNTAGGSQHAPHFAHCRAWIGYIHEAERTQRDVERPVGELEFLGVHPLGRHVRQPLPAGALARDRNHLRREIDADHAPGRPDGRRRTKRDEAGSAGHVDHALARRQRGEVEQQRLRRHELRRPIRLIESGRLVPSVSLDPALQARVHR